MFGKLSPRLAGQGNRINASPFIGARVYRSAAQNVGNSTSLMIPFDGTSFDVIDLQNPSINPSRVTLGRLGRWLCSWQIGYAGGVATGERYSTIYRNGVAASERSQPGKGGVLSVYVDGMDVVTATSISDYIELEAFQSSGGTLALTVGESKTFLAVQYLGT